MKRALGVVFVSLVLSGIVSLAAAQDQPPAPSPQEPPKEEPTAPHVMVIEVGSRSGDRTLTDTPVPVDVIAVSEIADQAGQLDLGQLLQFAAPSFNSNRQSGSDGSDHVDAATLRGLGPDQVLVLINGKRRHTSSLVYLFGSRARGNVGTDLNTIPVSAIERIEILRDGAAAQYGSDAIAGVINIVLRKDRGMSVLLSGGAFTAGDGENGQVAVNYGVPVGQGGTLSLTGEFLSRDKTNRAGPDEPRVIGDAATDNLTFFYNLDLPVGDTSTFYGHGGYNDRAGEAGAWYRGGVDSDDIPSRNSAAMYPNGFVPTIGTDIEDFSAAFGYRTVAGNWSVDVSTTYGSNRMRFEIRDTLNASIATGNNGMSPTAFDAGGFEFTQNTTNLDLSRFYKERLHGVEPRGGPRIPPRDVRNLRGRGAARRTISTDREEATPARRGFPASSPSTRSTRAAAATAAYVDVELHPTARLLLTAALRAEDYDDFGKHRQREGLLRVRGVRGS